VEEEEVVVVGEEVEEEEETKVGGTTAGVAEDGNKVTSSQPRREGTPFSNVRTSPK
jgi:hypothetical protein